MSFLHFSGTALLLDGVREGVGEKASEEEGRRRIKSGGQQHGRWRKAQWERGVGGECAYLEGEGTPSLRTCSCTQTGKLGGRDWN